MLRVLAALANNRIVGRIRRASQKRDGYELALWAALAAGLIFSLTALLAGFNNGLLDFNDFRQSQTALTIDWLTRGGPWFGYETPVIGHPWQIPFEFPLYQWIVALLHALGMPLNPAGRLVNWVMYAGSIYLAALVMRRLGASPALILIFAILVLFSPLYAFWSRTVLIEATATFVAMLFLLGIVEHLHRPRTVSIVLIIVGAALAALVKITTFFSFACAGGLIVLTHLVLLAWRERKIGPLFQAAWAPAAGMALSVAVLFLWLHYCDALKLQNPAAALFTSENLSGWTYGTMAQRLDPANWTQIFFGRAATDALGSPLVPLLALPIAIFLRKPLIWGGSALLFYVAPFLVFTNLHTVHNYYQYANAAFLILFVSATIEGIAGHPVINSARAVTKVVALALLACVVLLQLATFRQTWWPAIVADQSGNRAVALSERIKERTGEDNVAFLIGYDWNAIIAYMSERRVITLPEQFAAIAMSSPIEAFTGGRTVDMVIDCEGYPQSALKPFVARAREGLIGYGFRDCIVYDRVGRGPTDSITETTPFRSDADLQPLSLPDLLSSAAGAVQYAALIQEAAPDGALVEGIFAHAPTDLSAAVPSGSSELVANFGMRSPSYTNSGTTKGVCFSIEAGPENGTMSEVWRRCLRPREVMTDQGMQEVSVELPANTARIAFRTSPATNGDASWGWSYWANPRVM